MRPFADSGRSMIGTSPLAWSGLRLTCQPPQHHLAERDESCCCDKEVSDHQDDHEGSCDGQKARC